MSKAKPKKDEEIVEPPPPIVEAPPPKECDKFIINPEVVKHLW